MVPLAAAVNAALLSALVAKWKPSRAVVEYVGARPGEAAGGAFAFGRSKGVVRAFAMTENAGSNQGGRFQPGQSGNPAGKPKGARHKTTLLAEKLMSDDAEAIVKKVIEAAKGDLAAARLVLDRIAPPRKASPIDIALPPLEGAEGIAAAHKTLSSWRQLLGELLLDEARGMTLSSLLEGRRKALETEELEKRIRRLEGLKA